MPNIFQDPVLTICWVVVSFSIAGLASVNTDKTQNKLEKNDETMYDYIYHGDTTVVYSANAAGTRFNCRPGSKPCATAFEKGFRSRTIYRVPAADIYHE